MKKLYFSCCFVFTFFLLCLSASAQVEQVFSEIVDDESSYVAAMDEWLSSKDAKAGQTTTLFVNVINGDSTTTHMTVLDFPDYDSWQTHMDITAKSSAFAKYQLRTSNVTTLGEGLYLHVADNGKSWRPGDYLYIMGINVTAGPVFVAAFREFLSSELVKKAPGLIRLVANRAGSDISHTVLVTAPSFAALNKYIDSSSGNKDMEAFVSKIGGIAAPTSGNTIYRVVKVWK